MRLESIQEWSDFMKTSNLWNYKTMAGKITMGVVLAAMIGSVDVASALGKDHDRVQNHDNGYNNPSERGYERHMQERPRGREYERHMQERPVWPYGYRGRGYGPPPVAYATLPPPVIYAPVPPPGITIFFPPIFIRP